MTFRVTVHKQTTAIIEIEDAAITSADDAITRVAAGEGTTVSTRTISAQFIPQDITPVG